MLIHALLKIFKVYTKGWGESGRIGIVGSSGLPELIVSILRFSVFSNLRCVNLVVKDALEEIIWVIFIKGSFDRVET